MTTQQKIFGFIRGFLFILAIIVVALIMTIYQNNLQTGLKLAIQCGEGGAVLTIDGNGKVDCDGEWGVFNFVETNTFACTPEGNTLTCDTNTGAIFTVSAIELPTPTPYPTYTTEEIEQLEESYDSEEANYSLTGFYDCGIYSVGVSTIENFGGGHAACLKNTTFVISLPVSISEIECVRSVYGWSCGTENQSFWFFLLPEW